MKKIIYALLLLPLLSSAQSPTGYSNVGNAISRGIVGTDSTWSFNQAPNASGKAPTFKSMYGYDIRYAPISGGSNYIRNQSTPTQTGSFNISGTGLLGGDLGVTGTGVFGKISMVPGITPDAGEGVFGRLTIGRAVAGGVKTLRFFDSGSQIAALTVNSANTSIGVDVYSGGSYVSTPISVSIPGGITSIAHGQSSFTPVSGTDLVRLTDLGAYVPSSSFSGTKFYIPRVGSSSPYTLTDGQLFDNSYYIQQGTGWNNTTDSVKHRNVISISGAPTVANYANIGIQNLNTGGASEVGFYNESGVRQLAFRAYNATAPFYPGKSQISSTGNLLLSGGGVDLVKVTSTGMGVGLPSSLGNAAATAIVDAKDARTGLTAGYRVYYGINSSTYALSSDQTTYGAYFDNIASRASGSNTLTNVGMYARAAAGQLNYAGWFGAGNVLVENNATFGGSLTPTHPVTVSSGTLGLSIKNVADDTNYERMVLSASSNVFRIMPEIGGTGVLRPLMVGSTQGQFQMSGSAVAVGNTGGAKVAMTAGSTSIGYPVELSTAALIASSGTQRGASALSHFNQTGTASSVGFFIGKYNQALGSGTAKLISATTLASPNTGAATEQFAVSDAGAIFSNSLTASTLLVSDASKNVVSSAVTSTEAGYLSGVTSAIQTQLNAKAPTASPSFTGLSSFINTTGPQLTVGYDGSNKFTTSVSSTGTVTNDATGSIARFYFNDPLYVVNSAGGAQFSSGYDFSNAWSANTASNGTTTFSLIGSGSPTFIFSQPVSMPTASPGTNTTQGATTAFVTAAITAAAPTATLTRGFGLTGSNYTPTSAATFGVDTTVVRTVANSVSLAQLQTKVNGYLPLTGGALTGPLTITSTSSPQLSNRYSSGTRMDVTTNASGLTRFVSVAGGLPGPGFEFNQDVTVPSLTASSNVSTSSLLLSNQISWAAISGGGSISINTQPTANAYILNQPIRPNGSTSTYAVVEDGGGAEANTTTVALTTANLNSLYPDVPVGYRVICGAITLGGAIYTKYTEAGSSDIWLTTAVTITP